MRDRPARRPAPHLKRRIGFWLLTLYGVGVIVGAGVYVLIGEVAGRAGDLTPLAFLLAGLAAAATGASFAELSSRMPESAGEAAYAAAAFRSQRLSVLVGLAVATVGVVAGAAVLKGGVGYLQALTGGAEAGWIIGLCLGLGLLAALGVAESLSAAARLTRGVLGGVAGVAAAGLLGEAPERLAAAPEATGEAGLMAGLFGGAFLAFFAFLGFEDMVNLAEETRDPRRTLPRAILTAFVIVTTLYGLVAWAAVRMVPPAELAASPRPLALVYETATGGAAGFIAVIAVAAALNGVLAQMVMTSRVLFGLGRRAAAFSVFHEAHPRFGTPLRATAAVCAVMTALSLFAPLSVLASGAVLLLLLVFVTMNIALIRLKRRGPAPEGALNLPVWAPWIGLGMSVAMLAAGLWSRLA